MQYVRFMPWRKEGWGGRFGGRAILFWGDQILSTEDMRPKATDSMSHEDIWGKNLAGRGTSAKVQRWGRMRNSGEAGVAGKKKRGARGRE